MSEELKRLLNADLKALAEYKSIPFWSWNNHLDENELVKQIEEMRSAGIGGFIMHARTGLKDEYLGEKWFSCIKACLDKAKELEMEAWIYDENGWPSGFVGGKLLENEDFRARFLEYSVGDFDNNAYAVYIKDDKEGFKVVSSKVNGIEEYHNVYLRISPANTDILNPEVVDAFIQETHEKYYERYKESFGKELVGFFTDEPQYYRWATPYTPILEEILENVKDGLIWLFIRDVKGYEFRQKYFGALNKLYTENFYNKLYKWCENHNCKLTGHSVEEPQLFTQMWGGAGVMPSYEYEHIPAIDCLCRECINEISPKQVGSVASQMGKSIVLTETFACSGNDVTPYELKSIAESQYFYGVNKMCQHLYPYSMAGQGKTDHPPVFSKHSNWFNEFKAFNDYFTKLGYIIGNTEENVDVAILHPMRDIWLDYIRQKDYESVKEIEENLKNLLVDLRKNGVKYHFVDETILAKYGKNENNSLVIGKRSYNTVLIPRMKNISKETYRVLKEYSGQLCVLDEIKYLDGKEDKICLQQNITLEEIKEKVSVKFSCKDGNCFITSRSGKLGDFLFIKNISATESSQVTLIDVAENYRRIDLETLKESNISNIIILKPNDSVILIKSEDAEISEIETISNDITKDFKITNITDNYLVLDRVEYKKENCEYSKNLPMPCAFEYLLREDYKGKLEVKQIFTLKETMPLTLIMEKAKFLYVKINGQNIDLTQNSFDVNFVESDITDKVKVGQNELVYAIDFYQHDGVHFALFDPLATESLRNCLYYDTSIENTYLKGDFIVNDDFSLSKRKDLPALTSQLNIKGYPFFKGEMTLKGNVNINTKDKINLALQGRFLVANAKINGKSIDFVLDNEADISNIVKDGENEIEIVVKSSLRNLFGPHHFNSTSDPFGVSPYYFRFNGHWQENGKYPDVYTDEYKSVSFGIDKVVLKLNKEKNYGKK